MLGRICLRVLEWLDDARHRMRLRSMTRTLADGLRGEDLACRYLQRKGFVIVGRNFQTRNGSAEVDVIAWDAAVLVFVEVKARSSDEFGTPDRAVDETKREKVARGAREYLRLKKLGDVPTRFDIVTVLFGPPVQVVHIPDAFGWRRAHTGRSYRAHDAA